MKKEYARIIKTFIRESIKYLLFLIPFILISVLLIKHNLFSGFDNFAINFKNEHLLNDVVILIMKTFSLLGEMASYIIILIFAYIIFRKKLYVPFFMTCSVGGMGLINKIVKHIICRPRPMVALVEIPDSYSFPSGHTACAFIFYFYLIYLVNKNIKDKGTKNIIVAILASIPILIGFSRVYLGVHYITDVLAGALIGLVTLIPLIKITNRIKKEMKW